METYATACEASTFTSPPFLYITQGVRITRVVYPLNDPAKNGTAVEQHFGFIKRAKTAQRLRRESQAKCGKNIRRLQGDQPENSFVEENGTGLFPKTNDRGGTYGCEYILNDR